jgi:hypothetical protein
MITGNTPRPVQQLMTRCTLTVTCLLLSGCSLCDWCIEKQTTKEDAQRAAVVLLARSGDSTNTDIHRIVKDAKGNESVEMDFNWNNITLAGIPLRLFAEKQKAQQFQLNVFESDSGKGIPGASMTEPQPIDDHDRKLTGLPLDTLLTVVLAFKNNTEEFTNPASFIVLFKKAKDVPRPVTITHGGERSHE